MISAEEELLDLAIDDMPVSGDEVREAMAAWKAEILREAVQKIRAYAGPPKPNPSHLTGEWVGLITAAQLIEPDKED